MAGKWPLRTLEASRAPRLNVARLVVNTRIPSARSRRRRRRLRGTTGVLGGSSCRALLLPRRSSGGCRVSVGRRPTTLLRMLWSASVVVLRGRCFRSQGWWRRTRSRGWCDGRRLGRSPRCSRLRRCSFRLF